MHLLIKVSDRAGYARWIRAVTGEIARLIVGAHKGEAQLQGVRFWMGQLFSRVAHWGRAFQGLKKYFELNELEIKTGLERLAARKILEHLRLVAQNTG